MTASPSPTVTATSTPAPTFSPDPVPTTSSSPVPPVPPTVLTNAYISTLPGGSAIASNIHNAPGWLPATTYKPATGPMTRVVNGPGWSPSDGSYHPGQPLNAYQLTSAGSCVSGTLGGPTGTGSAIQDGTCTWKYLSLVDYISLTGWGFDAPAWQSGVAYTYCSRVT